MATLPPPPEPLEGADPEPSGPNPWDNWQAAGIDPSYDPHQAREALNFWRALGNRDQREYAVQQVAGDFLPEGMSIREAREILSQHGQEDPWAQITGGGYEEEYAEPAAPALDPQAFRNAIDSEIERRLAERDQRDAQERAQMEYEAEFTREVDRVGDQHSLEGEERLWLAAQANVLRQEQPYATTAQIMDEAGKRFMANVNRRLQALSQAQQDHPAPPLPGGAIPSPDQVPQNVEQAQEAARRFFAG